ncbi:MAG: M28 family peptidase [Flavobacteriales bacterium]|nr:M28 family peptidase [Flavobacteriales bacterium]MCX7649454.1 M28 family peptidase [Flavobacteriales bacterium]MDW8432564.1 M28 family peptidase [Flavobacteriales bacterium]
MAFARLLLCFLTAVLLLDGCGPDKKPQPPVTSSSAGNAYIAPPVFSEDSAWVFLKKQVSFGPRIPNTEAHRRCGDWLIQMARRWCDTVVVQNLEILAHDGKMLRGRNIVGSFLPHHKRRILLAAHWDTRPQADEDPQNKGPFAGADDGASGVAVLLEILRILSNQKPALGVDVIFFDLEDYGRSDAPGQTFCLGSQHWSRQPHLPGYRAEYGILLDMVGARNARFLREGYSVQYAAHVVDKVWFAAGRQGYGHLFVNQGANPVTDDHYFVNKLAGIPCIDIINYHNDTGGFPDHWHTQKDNLEIIDKATLKGVGQTLLDVIFNP